MNAKLYFKDADGTWIEVEGFIGSIQLSVSVTSNVLSTATIEMNITDSRALQASEVPTKDCYEEWERMVLKGVQ